MRTIAEKNFLEQFYKTKGHHIRKNPKNNRLLVYVYDESYKGNRKLLSKATRKELDDAVIEHYHANEPTFEDIYQSYYSLRFTNKESSTRDRWDCTWNKYFKNSKFSMKPISQFKLSDIEDFVYPLVNEQCTRKQAHKITSIIKAVFHRAISKELRLDNPMNNFEIPNSYLLPEKQKSDNLCVLSEKDLELLRTELKLLINHQPVYCAIFAVLLVTYTGVRAGEVVALKWSDIENGFLYVQRAEQKYRKRDSDGNLIKGIEYRIGHVKTKNSIRKIPLNSKAIELLNLLKQWQENNHIDSEWLFINPSDERISTNSVEKKYRQLWNRLKLESGNGGLHCLRKTFCTQLAKKGLLIYELQKIMGHSEIQTTQKYYIKIEVEKASSLSYLEAI